MGSRCQSGWLLGLTLALFGAVVLASPPPWGPYRVDARMNPHPTSPGPANLLVAVTPLFDCDEITLSITRLDNIAIIGPWEITQKSRKDSLTSFEIRIDIPANDTAGFVFHLQPGTAFESDQYYWVASEDTIEFHLQNPKYSTEAIDRGRKRQVVSGEDTALIRARAEAAKHPNGIVMRGRHDDSGRWINEEDYQRDHGILSESVDSAEVADAWAFARHHYQEYFVDTSGGEPTIVIFVDVNGDYGELDSLGVRIEDGYRDISPAIVEVRIRMIAALSQLKSVRNISYVPQTHMPKGGSEGE